MIGWIEKLLKRVGWVEPFDKDEMLNAEADNELHDYEAVANKVRNETDKRRVGNAHLRKILLEARRKTNGFADMERLVRGDTTHAEHAEH